MHDTLCSLRHIRIAMGSSLTSEPSKLSAQAAAARYIVGLVIEMGVGSARVTQSANVQVGVLRRLSASFSAGVGSLKQKASNVASLARRKYSLTFLPDDLIVTSTK